VPEPVATATVSRRPGLIRVLRRISRSRLVASVTALGWALLIGIVVTGIPGWWLGWLEFRALSVMCVVVMVVAVLSVLGRREHEVLFELQRPRVQVGDEARGNVQVRSEPGRSSGSATLEFPVNGEVASFRVPALGPGQVHEEPFSIPARRRGVILLGPVRSAMTDPLAAVSRKKVLSDVSELFVHPRVVPLETRTIGFLRDIEGIATQNLSSSDVSFHALREYVPGDDRRSVHWRTTARTGKLMVRQFEETMRAHLLILLSTLPGDYASPEDFELAVSVAGSLGVAALREEKQVTLCTSKGEVPFPNAMGLLDRLSGVELDDKGHELRELAVKHGSMPGISVAAFVTGSPSPAVLRSSQLALPPGVFPFAVRCLGGEELARRRVGDLIVLDIPQLDDLRPAVGSLA